MRAVALLALFALAACAKEPENPFERELGPPQVQTEEQAVYHKHVGIRLGPHGARVGGGITRTKGNFSIGIGF